MSLSIGQQNQLRLSGALHREGQPTRSTEHHPEISHRKEKQQKKREIVEGKALSTIRTCLLESVNGPKVEKGRRSVDGREKGISHGPGELRLQLKQPHQAVRITSRADCKKGTILTFCCVTPNLACISPLLPNPTTPCSLPSPFVPPPLLFPSGSPGLTTQRATAKPTPVRRPRSVLAHSSAVLPVSQ